MPPKSRAASSPRRSSAAAAWRSGATLIQIADTEVAAQAREADANAAQIEARLGTASGAAFDVERVPEVANARASYELARTEFERTKMLQERQLVSRSEFDQQQAQVEASRRQYEVAKNGAEQQYQALMGASARVAMARKAVDDTVVRAPFDGVVGERLVSVGDYVTRGTKVASIMRVSPLRLELTVPAQYVTAVAVGERRRRSKWTPYPGETFVGQVRFVSPALRSETRALVVEAIVANRRRPPEAGAVRHGADRTGGEVARAAGPGGRRAEDRDRQPRVRRRRRSRRGAAHHDRPDAKASASKRRSGLAAGDRVVVGGLERLKDGARVKAGS